MASLSKYWMFVSLDPGGGYRQREVAVAKLFVQQQVTTAISLTETDEATDQAIQQHLVACYQGTAAVDGVEPQRLAELCLRCFISQQILHVCRQLAAQFGQPDRFDGNDLLPYVLNDDWRADGTFISLAQDILTTFAPQRSNLATWTSRKVKHDRTLNEFLLERGVYLISDWAILNDTKPHQLERLLREFHQLATVDVQHNTRLLQSYHQVYRADRLQQPSARRGQACLPPSDNQLQRIAQLLSHPDQSPHELLQQLQTLAEWVRQYRLHIRGGSPLQASLDQPQYQTVRDNLTTPTASAEADEQMTFLTTFRAAFLTALEHAIAHVTQWRLQRLYSKNPTVALNWLTALELFHCQGQAMGAIAPQVGLQQQYQVSRLLDLKQFRDGVRHHMLVLLRDTCLQQTDIGCNPARLHALDAALEELINEVFQETATATSQTSGTLRRSRFAQHLCQYLCQLEAGHSPSATDP